MKRKRASSTPDTDLCPSELESSFFVGTSTRVDIPSCDISHREDPAQRDREKQQERASERGPGEDMVDLKACEDVVTSKILSFSEKYEILLANLKDVLRSKLINLETARYIISYIKLFSYRNNDTPLPDNWFRLFTQQCDEEIGRLKLT